MASEAELCETENGGQHVLMAKESGEDKHVRDHLIIMVNGIGGSGDNWKFAADQFIKKFPDKVLVHCSERNASRLTLDGVDVMGERLADEVATVIKCNPGLKKISFIAHSVGGLVARYCIGRLYDPTSSDNITVESKGELTNGNTLQHEEEQSNSKIAGLEPVNFITVATPHLGSKGRKQVPFLFGLPFLEKVACLGVHIFIGRTGRHLFLTDTYEGKLPLLRRMLNDCGDLYFMSALRAFKRRVAYSNVGYDHIVGWRTSSIRLQSELPKFQDPVDERYPHIVNIEDTDNNSHKPRSPVSKEDNSVNPEEEEMVAGLTKVSWQRVDVSFHASKQRFDAHSTIQNEQGVEVGTHRGATVVRGTFPEVTPSPSKKKYYRKGSSSAKKRKMAYMDFVDLMNAPETEDLEREEMHGTLGETSVASTHPMTPSSPVMVPPMRTDVLRNPLPPLQFHFVRSLERPRWTPRPFTEPKSASKQLMFDDPPKE